MFLSFFYNETIQRQWLVNKGKCGICGDAFDERIKPHEAPGGIFATGTIVRTFRPGQVIPITLQLTAVHKGFYEFKLCPNNNPRQDPSQECFDRLIDLFAFRSDTRPSIPQAGRTGRLIRRRFELAI